MLHRFKHIVAIARSVALVATSLTLSLGATQARAQQYGPRQFSVTPSGIHIFQIQGFHLESNTTIDTSIVYPDFGINIEGIDVDINTDALVFTYAPTFNIGETLGQLVLSLPYGWVNVDASAGSLGISSDQSGFADFYTELRVGLVNAPGLNLQEFVQYMAEENPRVQVRALLGITIPSGEYSSDRLVNIGTNRWTFRGGVPVIIRLSNNWRPGNRTTLEFTPIVNVFTDNNSPPLSTNDSATLRSFAPDRTAQNPLLRIEAHLTQDLGEQFWASFDALYVAGGATYDDGVGQNDQVSWLALGGTVGANIWQGGSLSVNGGGVVARNDSSPDGWEIRVVLTQAFR